MNVIKVMNENLASKIAAGEVVERCSSIVKELVENSLDAGASQIQIELEAGGRLKIKVIDNGQGMTPRDALIAFERHATSKIYQASDLFLINTLGFRGEALPSIASVAEVELETGQKSEGIYIHVKGGQILNQTKRSARKGTAITVTNLFYNMPVRLKFLKSVTTELSSSLDLIEKLALAYPKVSFQIKHNSKLILKTTGSGNLLKTIHEIYDLKVTKNMLKIQSSNDDFELSGYLGKPEILKSTRRYLITIVNGRVIHNNELNQAINEAYYTYKPKTQYPMVVLNIKTDPTLIDINIHPTKQDIKISKITDLKDLIIHTIKSTLASHLLIPMPLVTEPSTDDITLGQPVMEEETSYQTTMSFQTSCEVKTKEVPKVISTLELDPIGLAFGTYIIATSEEGLFLIDQHAAQERINYEKYLKALKAIKLEVTSMLFPLKLEYSPSDFLKLKTQFDLIRRLGFEIIEFGTHTLLVKAHPTWLQTGYEEQSIRLIFDLIITKQANFDPVKFNESLAIMLACKMSIKANTHLSLTEMSYLLSELATCENPYNCPHGRPTIIKFTIYELEKMFKRVMN